MVTGLPRRSTVRITAGSHVVCSTSRQLPVLSMCSLSQTRQEKSIPDAAFSVGARHKNSDCSRHFFRGYVQAPPCGAHAHTCPACAHRREDGAFFRLRHAAAQRADAHEEWMHILTLLLNSKRCAYIFPLKLIYDKNVL